MIPAIKAEFGKLLTVRSTYIITLVSLIFVAFYAGYIEGYKAIPTSALMPGKLASEVLGAVGAMAIFGALVAVLLFAHEYRYGTIMYTLTASNSRTKSLLAKIIAVTVFALVFTTVIGIFSPIATFVGLHLKGVELAPQTFYYRDLLWRGLLYGWGYAMVGLLLISLIRNQIGAIVALFIIPSTVETVLSLLLKSNSVYLPFTALAAIVNDNPAISHTKAAAVFAVYLVGGWLVSWFLFLRRDAN